MYCNKCGNLLDDTDLFCKKCGTEITEQNLASKSSEDISDSLSNQFHADFSWNVHDFPTQKKTEEVDFEWGPDPYESLRAKSKEKQKEKQNDEDTISFPSTNTDSIKESLKEETISGKELETEIFKDLPTDMEDSVSLKDGFGPDKFFTFSRKNEEFQKLLDKEYEKIKEHSHYDFTKSEARNPLSEKVELPEEIENDLLLESKTNQSVEPSSVQDKLHKNKPLVEDNADIAVEQLNTPANVLEKEIEQEQLHKIDKGYLDKMAEARESYFSDNSGQTNEKEIIKRKFDTLDITVNSTQALKVEVAMNNETQSKVRITAPEPNEGITVTEVVEIQPSAKTSNPIPNVVAMDLQKEEKAEPNTEENLIPREIVPELDTKEEKTKPKWILKTVLGIIVIALIAELSFLGIKFFAPDSNIAQFLNKKEAKVAAVFSEMTSKKDDTKQEEKVEKKTVKAVKKEETKDANATKTTEPDPNPVADKNILINNQKDKNVNINTVRANDKLKFVGNRNYGIADINNSLPITNNIWRTTDKGETIYYDNEIVGTLIAFDSQWVDYVNRGSEAVLNLVKKGSPAEHNAVTFSKVGKAKETFNLLEIGEIRKGATYYYVWCHEEIRIVEGGNTKSASYHWIYTLEPIGDKIQIVNYYKF